MQPSSSSSTGLFALYSRKQQVSSKHTTAMIDPQDLDYALETVQRGFQQGLERSDVYAMIAGTAAFSSTLALSTYVMQQVLRISTATNRPIPSLSGVASVCLASVASHHAAIATNEYVVQGKLPTLFDIRRRQRDTILDTSFRRKNNDFLDLHFVQIPLHTLRICCLGLLTFKLLGGRFWSVAPSSYVHHGSFARPRVFSLKATSVYATETQRLALQRMGRLAGCHTCGTRMLFQRPRFNGDHMPPLLVANELNRIWYRKLFRMKVKFRFFPQCIDCSNTQGGIMSQARAVLDKQPKNLLQRKVFQGTDMMKLPILHSKNFYHGLQPRISHLTGTVLGGFAVLNSSEADIANGNRNRYERLHKQLSSWCKNVRNNDMVVKLVSSLQRPK
ncbi:hypothetical protein MPSEU_001091000 [Mayamaea pseudoterrestris]|nr:hypothetical protein MPSEU_001091000 [Mayamaea pseudoterrestris]